MNALQTICQDDLEALFEPLIRKEGQVSLTYQSPSGWRMLRCSAVSHSRTDRTITVKTSIVDSCGLITLPHAGDVLSFSFRRGHKKCMFHSLLELVERHEDEGFLHVRWPDQLCQLQRRLCERVQPPVTTVIPVRIWAGSSALSSESPARDAYNGQIEDLSVSGVRIKIARADELELGATYRCAFTPIRGVPAVVVSALLRHREAADHGRACIGLQFIGLEGTPEGRQTLDTLAKSVSQFQRARSRSGG